MIDKKTDKEDGIYSTLLKVAEARAREERRGNRLSFLGEGKGGFGGLLSFL